MKKIYEKINLSPRQIIDIFLLILLVIFIGQNLEMVKVKFLFFGFTMPLILIIIIVFIVGFYTALAFSRKKQKGKSDLIETIPQV